jgi:hypothetical protein
MRLRVSGEQTGHEYNLQHVMDGGSEDSELPNGNILNAFVEAIFNRDLARISIARSAIVNVMGEQAMVDAAATIAAFNVYPRMADATGIPLEDTKRDITSEMREELGMEILRYTE